MGASGDDSRSVPLETLSNALVQNHEGPLEQRSGSSWSEICRRMGVRALAAQGIAAPALRDIAAGRVAQRGGPPPELVPFDADARKVVQPCFRHALLLRHNHGGTENILLALAGHGNGGGVLAQAGLDVPADWTFVTAERTRESLAHAESEGKRA